MLEAQVALNSTEDGIANQGDVIVLALAGHPWGTEDRRRLLVVEWSDSLMEDALLARRKSGEQWPVLSYPYRVRETQGKREVTLRRSSKTVDIPTLTAQYDVLDPTKEVPILRYEEISLVSEAKPGLLARFWNWLVS